MKLKLIVAMCKNMGIGFNNNIPWKIKQDLIYFSSKTCGLYGKYLKNKDPTVITMEHLVKPTRKYTIFIENLTNMEVQIFSDFEAKKRWLENNSVEVETNAATDICGWPLSNLSNSKRLG